MPANQDILKELRKDKGFTQEDVGAYLGISGSSYANYETGRRKMRVSMLEKLADIFGTSTDYILGLTANPKPYAPRIKNE